MLRNAIGADFGELIRHGDEVRGAVASVRWGFERKSTLDRFQIRQGPLKGRHSYSSPKQTADAVGVAVEQSAKCNPDWKRTVWPAR